MSDRLAKSLSSYTPARVGLQKTGVSLATAEVLDFQLAHAQARDAVHAALDGSSLREGLRARHLPALFLHSAASDRSTYLRHPNLGRSLSPESIGRLKPQPCDVVVVIADGLSAVAVDRHALPLLDTVLPLLPRDWTLGPVCVVEQGRVAVGDVVGAALPAEISVVLIGERPGLSSPDSLGAYITWQPRPGRSDAERNCISNIRLEGLHYEAAARKLAFYLTAARAQKLTGVALKESSLLPTSAVVHPT
ncbi:MAG: ethanolamine ammonia-lyase subunit EutC [Acidobacteria bacterium]|nr:ethanolamine ammonia-lyase subunit EutC [Acidobacteriota bacterium]